MPGYIDIDEEKYRRFVEDPILDLFTRLMSEIMAVAMPTHIHIKNGGISYAYEDKVHEALNSLRDKREEYIEATYK